MKVASIIGNGFNFLIEDIIRNWEGPLPKYLSNQPNALADKIHEISKLWEKFDTIFQELRGKVHGVNDEELIRMIYAVIDFLSNVEIFEKVLTKDQIQNIKNAFDFLLIERIKEIASEFKDHQSEQGYKDLKKLFPSFGESFNTVLDRNGVSNFDFYTTNYDGVLDTLLTKNPRGFLAVDGFGNVDGYPHHLKLYDDNFNSKIKCLHMHGSYRFEKKYGITMKTKSNAENADPVIVFNNPDQKEELIYRDTVLNEYYYRLSKSMKESKKLIIFGNSMQNEPHLKKKIFNEFNSSMKSIHICSRSPEMIESKLLTSNTKIVLWSTRNIKTIEGVIDLFDQIIKHDV